MLLHSTEPPFAKKPVAKHDFYCKVAKNKHSLTYYLYHQLYVSESPIRIGPPFQRLAGTN